MALLLLTALLPFAVPARAAGIDDFVITVKTDNTGTSTNTQFTIPTTGGGYDYNVDCNNDGTDEVTGQTGNYTCTYGATGTYTIRISDNSGAGTGFPRIHFNGGGDRRKLLTVEQWGTGHWTSMENAFQGCSNLTVPATDAPDLSGVSDMTAMFSGAGAFNQDISNWNVVNVMWMSYMFFNANHFNQPIGAWNTTHVRTMDYMFHGATAFDQNLGNWDTSSVTDMAHMFENATAFNRNLGGWDVTALTNAANMFSGATLSPANYDSLLIGWDAQTLKSGVTFDGGNSTYCRGESAHSDMISTYGWTITDGGKDCDDFVIAVKTDNPGTSSATQFTIPTSGGGYNYNVDCDSDGTEEASGQTGDYTCNYGAAGSYTIRISDNNGDGTGFPRIYFNGGGDADKLLRVEQWGTTKWSSMAHAFHGCSNLRVPATDAPDLSGVTDMTGMFRGAGAFNQDIGAWDTSNITDMTGVFRDAGAFNQDIGAWNTSSVTDMSSMFRGAGAFNKDISGWNTGHVANMRYMFAGAGAFNRDIGGWNTGSVSRMEHMFEGATAFDRNLGNWDVTVLTDATAMFAGVALSPSNYDSLLIGWDAQSIQPLVTFDGGASTYCQGESARFDLIGSHLWTITDRGRECNDFVITVTTKPWPLQDTYFRILTTGGGYDYNVDCDNDGTDEATGVTGNYTCNYGVPGTYTIRIRDNSGAGTGFPRIYVHGDSREGPKLLSVDQWGAGHWTSMAHAFQGCSNMTVRALDVPDLSGVTDMSYMFAGATSFDQNINAWDTSNITNMSYLFYLAQHYDQPLGLWDTSHVTDMSSMFAGADLFARAIGAWDTSSVTTMAHMFQNTSYFNQNISAWNTSSVTNMSSMFQGAGAFNKDISGWDTGKVTTMAHMFDNAAAFDRNLGAWNVTALNDATAMFGGAALSIANYDALLIGWDAQTLQSGVTFDGGNSTYCKGESARSDTIGTYGWTITDGGKGCGNFVIRVKTDNPGSSGNTQFTIPTTGSGYDYNVDCNDDGTNEAAGLSGDYTCNYGAAGTYTIRIKDNSGAGTGLPRIYFNGGGDAGKLVGVTQWGTGHWTSMANAFQGCSNLTVTATDIPDLSGVTTMNHMFAGAGLFNQDIAAWDTSHVANMGSLFRNAGAFDQDIGQWDTSKVNTMNHMFAGAGVFDQDISGWDVSALTDATAMFAGAALSIANYDALLIGWDAQTLQSGVTFDGGNSTYCQGEIARGDIIGTYGWTITDGGKGCGNFVIRVKTDNPGSSGNTQFTIPTTGSGYDYNVDCNDDGTNEATGLSGDYTCNYGAAGTYTIRISDNSGADTGFPRIYFNGGGDGQKLLSVEQWGAGKWTSMAHAFDGCSNLSVQAPELPDLSGLTDMSYMFANAGTFNEDIGVWDTSTVTDMSHLFDGATAFNQDIGPWDTSNVSDMSAMFTGTGAFDQDIGTWDTGSVTNMSGMFRGAGVFNQDISGWDTGSATDMSYMFAGTGAFNWNIGGWNTGAVTTMAHMFEGAGAFNRNIGAWNVTALTDATAMFAGVGLSLPNYDALLIGWGAQVLQTGVIFDGGISTFCQGESARTNMISSFGWTITDGGRACDVFVMTVKTDNGGASSNTQFRIPTSGGGYNYNVDCDDDGVYEASGVTGNYTCNYSLAGTYTIRIRDNGGLGTGFPRIYFNGGGDARKLLSVEHWGTGHWTSMGHAFQGCSNLNVRAADAPDLSGVTDMSYMFATTFGFNDDIGAWNTSNIRNMSHLFEQAFAFNRDIGSWDTGNVTDMSFMFYNDTAFDQDIGGWNTSAVTNMKAMFANDNHAAFNQDISGWNTANVIDMSSMFQDQQSFNQPIGSWDIGSVTTTKGMFWGATLFNQDIGGWDTTNVADMSSMFYHADAFNQDIGAWNTSNVNDMNSMFSSAAAFDQDIGGWDTATVTDMGTMFERATAFDQDIGSWDIRSLTLAYNMFSQITLSTANYDSLLMGWGGQAVQPNVDFDGGNSTYCLGESARSDMVSADGWTITDGGKDCSTVRVWDGGGMNNNWSTAANWVRDVVPLPTDSVAFDGTSSKDAVFDAAFGATVGSIFISDQYAGRLSFAAALAVAGYLNEEGGSVTIDPANNFTVDGSLYHSGGILQQVRPVNVADVNFLEIENSSGSRVKHRGVEIDTTTSGSNLGDTTVAIRAVDIDSGEYCASTDATSPAYVGRCFSLTPTFDGPARVRLWARSRELNGIADVDLAVYRLTTPGWGELGNRIVGSDGAGYRYAEGDAPGFSGFLLGEAGSPPVPVTLQSFEIVSFDARKYRLFGLR